MPVNPVEFEGLASIQEGFALGGKEVKAELTGVLKGLAEPVRTTAEGLAIEKIRRMTMEWSRMRVGISTASVYVAPVARGVKKHGDPRNRPNLFDLLLGRALEPALDQNIGGVVAGVEAWLGGVVDDVARK